MSQAGYLKWTLRNTVRLRLWSNKTVYFLFLAHEMENCTAWVRLGIQDSDVSMLNNNENIFSHWLSHGYIGGVSFQG